MCILLYQAPVFLMGKVEKWFDYQWIQNLISFKKMYDSITNSSRKIKKIVVKHKLRTLSTRKTYSRGAKAWTLFCLEQQILLRIIVVWYVYNESLVGRQLQTLGILFPKVIKVTTRSKTRDIEKFYIWVLKCAEQSLRNVNIGSERIFQIECQIADL